MTDAPTGPQAHCDDIARFIAESRALLSRGDFIQLGALDKRVEMLCKSVLQLSQAERDRFAEPLSALLADLSALGNELTAQRDAVAETLRGVTHHRKANVAYRVADCGAVVRKAR